MSTSVMEAAIGPPDCPGPVSTTRRHLWRQGAPDVDNPLADVGSAGGLGESWIRIRQDRERQAQSSKGEAPVPRVESAAADLAPSVASGRAALVRTAAALRVRVLNWWCMMTPEDPRRAHGAALLHLHDTSAGLRIQSQKLDRLVNLLFAVVQAHQDDRDVTAAVDGMPPHIEQKASRLRFDAGTAGERELISCCRCPAPADHSGAGHLPAG